MSIGRMRFCKLHVNSKRERTAVVNAEQRQCLSGCHLLQCDIILKICLISAERVLLRNGFSRADFLPFKLLSAIFAWVLFWILLHPFHKLHAYVPINPGSPQVHAFTRYVQMAM